MKVVSILFSALFTALTAECLGLLLLQRLRPRFTREEQYLYAFVTGSALLSLLVFLIAAVHLVWPATFAALGAVAIGACIWTRAYVPAPERFQPLPVLYQLLFWGCLVSFGSWYLMNALAPEASADGSMYHLGLVQTYIDQRGFGRITTSMYANLALGIEMLFLFAFSLGRHSAAALVHFFFLIALPLGMVATGRRFGYPRAGVTAGILVFISPIFGYDGSSAYVDVAVACIVFSLFSVLQIWEKDREQALLPLIGLLAGFAYAAKLTAFVAIPYAVIFVLYKMLRRRQPFLKPITIVCAGIALMAGPWLLKNAITVGNPFSPFLNQFFPNPYIRIRFEETYREFHRAYSGLKSFWDIPMEVTLRGGVLHGLLGPMFLLAPLGLLSTRWKLGRQCLLAALVFASTYPGNVGTRFLIPAAPFAAFALAMTLAHWRGMAPLAILAGALFCWPDVVPMYAAQYVWRLDTFYWRAALRLQPESEYLNQRMGEYAPAKLAEQRVPKDGKIFTYGGIAKAYCRREVIVSYESALGNRFGDSISAAMVPHYQPTRWWTYIFPRQPIRKLRLWQTTSSKTDVWSVSELRLLGPQGELPRSSGWRLKAHPNPWEVQLAFDNCPTTRWTAAERSQPGMYLQVELGQPRDLVAVRVEATPDQADGTARLEAEIDGQWKVLAEKPVLSDSPPLTGTRRLATGDLRREGITHIHVGKDDYFAADMADDPTAWGVTLVGEANGYRLYKIDQ